MGTQTECQQIAADNGQQNEERVQQRQMEQLFRLAVGRQKTGRIIQVCCGYTDRLAGASRIFNQHGITSFHHDPVFELIVFSFAPGKAPEDDLLPILQYCRMLLRPRGRIALLLPGDPAENWYHHLFTSMSFGRGVSCRCAPFSLLVRAGFVDVRKQVQAGIGRVVTGCRPLPVRQIR